MSGEKEFMAALLDDAIDMASTRLTYSSSFSNGDSNELYTTIKWDGNADSLAPEAIVRLDGGFDLATTGTWKERSNRSYVSDDWSGSEKNLYEIAIGLRIANGEHAELVGADIMRSYDYVYRGEPSETTKHAVAWEKIHGLYGRGWMHGNRLPEQYWELAEKYPFSLFGFKAIRKLE